MGYHNELFPLTVGYGSSGGMGHKTTIFVLDSGQEQRVGRWSTFRKVYDARTGVRTPADIATLRHFLAARRGSLHSFPVLDRADYSTAADDVSAPTAFDQFIGAGTGSKTDFQMYKQYGDATNKVTWNIIKPIPNTTLVAVNGVAKTVGVDYNVDSSTGMVAITVAPALGFSVTIGCQFYVPCRFGDDVDDEYLTSMADVGVSDAEQIIMIEDMYPTAVADEYYYGGALSVAIPSGHYTPDLLSRALTVTDVTGDIWLPDPLTLPFGGPFLVIKNGGGGPGLEIRDHLGNLITTLTNNVSRSVWLFSSGGGKLWVLV